MHVQAALDLIVQHVIQVDVPVYLMDIYQVEEHMLSLIVLGMYQEQHAIVVHQDTIVQVVQGIHVLI